MWRFRFGDFFSRMWLEYARRPRSLPVAVFLKRFLAPEWLFIFGMANGVLKQSPGRGRYAAGCDSPAVLPGARIMCMLRPSCWGACSTTAMLAEVSEEPVEQRPAAFGVRLLAAAEHDRDLDLVLLVEEALDVALLGLVVVVGDLRPQLDLADVDLLLVLAGCLAFCSCSYLYFE